MKENDSESQKNVIEIEHRAKNELCRKLENK